MRRLRLFHVDQFGSFLFIDYCFLSVREDTEMLLPEKVKVSPTLVIGVFELPTKN